MFPVKRKCKKNLKFPNCAISISKLQLTCVRLFFLNIHFLCVVYLSSQSPSLSPVYLFCFSHLFCLSCLQHLFVSVSAYLFMCMCLSVPLAFFVSVSLIIILPLNQKALIRFVICLVLQPYYINFVFRICFYKSKD